MAIFYCDLVSGSDANDGLTTATPKLTINGVTSLVTAYTDECRVRGMDSLFTDIGSWTWTNESRTIVYTGADKTADVPANSYVCKTVVASGTTVPEIYKVTSSAYAGGNTTATLTLTATYNYYVGTTETVPTSKLVLPSAIAAQTINKNGYYSGTQTDLTGRIFSKVTGGWNSSYTAQSTWTFHYGTATNLIIGKVNWEFSRFIYITTGNLCWTLESYMNIKDCFFGWNSTTAFASNNRTYNYFNNIKSIGSNNGVIAAAGITNGLIDNSMLINNRAAGIPITMTNSTIQNSILGLSYRNVLAAGTGNVINCMYYGVNNTALNSAGLNVSGSTFYDAGSTANIATITNSGNIVNCIFNVNINRSTAYISGSYYPINSYTFLNNSGATGQFMRLNANGIFYNTTRFKLYQTNVTTTALKWYNTNNEDLGLSDFTSSDNNDNLQKNVIYNYTTGTTKNAILSKYGYTTLSDDYYSGKTGGTNSILHVVSTNNAECDFTNVDFVINKSNAYNLSFYAKGSGSYTLHWNILNGGEYLYAWQTQAINASTWTNITKAISASDWKMSGTATLVIRIPSQAKGTYALIDYIQLT